jgi:hypothetical protein
VNDLHEVVNRSADAADLHAPAQTLLLDLQALLGSLSASLISATNRGRSPFRPNGEWNARLGALAYGVYLLADQTGVDLNAAVVQAAADVGARRQLTSDLPF